MLCGVDRDTQFLIRAAKDIKLKRFVEVFDLMKGMHFKKVGFQMETKR